MKDRIIQPFILLGLILVSIIYGIILMSTWPVFLIGSFFWKTETCWKMYNVLYNSIPKIPDTPEEDEDE